MQVNSLILSLALTANIVVETAESSPYFPNYRLPNKTFPEHYYIQLTTNVHINKRTFLGEVIIDIFVAAATSNIVLHARELNICKVTIVNPYFGESEELSYAYEVEREFLTLTRKIDQQFAAGTKWLLTIVYSGELLNDKGGFYLSKYINSMGQVRFFAATQFESTNARCAFPCYDEPDKRARFTITLNHSPTYTAISNMPINKAQSSAGKTVFLTTARIPTYRVVFAVSDIEYSEVIFNGLALRVYSCYSAKSETMWALVSDMMIAENLSKYFGVKFVHSQRNQVALTNNSPRKISNWHLAIYSEKNLMCDTEISGIFMQTKIAKAVAREISYQWLGNYVAIKWWSYLWLMEGFAIFISYRALDSIYPEWDVWQEFHYSNYQYALDNDDGNYPRPMTFFVQTPEEIKSLYDSVYNSKAASVLLMWNNALTDNIFQKGLQHFWTKYQYSTVDEEKLFAAIQNAVERESYVIPVSIAEMMSTWTNQGGFPLLTVIRNYEDGTFTVQQEAFYDDETAPDNKTWYVPINYAVASSPDFKNTKATYYLLKVSEMKIDDVKISRADWLMLNKQSTGFYRITYDVENWNLIVEALIENPKMIHFRNRAQLMQDAYHLIITNRLDHEILLKMLTYLKQEDQYAPWATAYVIFSKYNRYLGSDNSNYEFILFVAEQVGPIYKKLGVNEIPSEHHLNRYTRDLVIDLACTIGIKQCLEETHGKLRELIWNKKQIEPSLVASIYCNGLRQSGEEEFNFLYQKLMNSADQDSRSLLVSYLSCSQNRNQIKKYIYSSIDKSNGLRTKERSSILRSVYQRGEMGVLACIEFLSEMWYDYGFLRSGNGESNPLDDDIRGIASFVINKNQEEKLLALVDKVKNSQHVTASLESEVRLKILDNNLWIKYHSQPIMTWISNYYDGNVQHQL